jgi:predicted nucleotidyltransferase
MRQIEFLQQVVTSLDQQGYRFMLVGSYGSSLYGEARFTQDIDIVIELKTDDVDRFCTLFPSENFYLSKPAIVDAIQQHFTFNVIHPSSGNKLDFMLPSNNAWGQSQLDRRQAVEILPDFTTYVASPEDLILGKLWYHHQGGGDRHLRDIAGMLKVSKKLIRQDEVTRWAKLLGVETLWEELRTNK